jgi:hypothetical protein
MLSQSKGGRAKNSIVSIVPYGAGGSHPGHVVLAASGYSRIGMIKSMARDHLNDAVRLNAVCPAGTCNEYNLSLRHYETARCQSQTVMAYILTWNQ